MKQIDDIALMAYADGELDAEEAREVERAIACDATLRAQLDSYRQSNELIREAYGPIAGQPYPAGILAAIEAQPDPVQRLGMKTSWPQRNWRPLAASIAAAAVIVTLIFSLQQPGERSVPEAGGQSAKASSEIRDSSSQPAGKQDVVRIGALAPDIAFTTVDGRARRLSEFRGRSVMLWLFATWCRTCRAATVAVAENYDRLNQAGLQIIQLKLHENLGYGGPTTKEFAAQYAGSRASASEWLWGEASKEGSFVYNPNGYPEIYCLVDKDGIVRDVAQAPNVTMGKIMTFATSNSPGKGT